MDVASSITNGDDESNRRRSGRTIRKPGHFGDENYDGSILSSTSAKRKRTTAAKVAENGVGKDEDEDESEEDSEEDESEDEPDEEELREKRKIQKKKAVVAKPAAKRTKTTNGTSTTLAFRSAGNQNQKTTKASRVQKARSRPSQAHKEGLYGEVFGKSNSAEDAAGMWLTTLEKDNVAAIRDLVNFALECIDCDVRIETADIEDIDNVPNKLGDVLDEYAQASTAEYPLISKTKQYVGFRTILVDFFEAIIRVLHNSSVFYDQPEVYDNVHVWVATMSGANYRPFRHTATVISLSMTTALCQVAQELQTSLANNKTLLETSKKQKNKGRVSDVQKSMKSDEKKLEAIEAQLRDAFDTVYVHRYRDVDEKIRMECVTALGNWIVLYRKMFLEGQYLRYLGWVMSDTNASVRLEVIKQLSTLFQDKRNVAALRAFTDRFRSRIVEMGTRDADIGVRVAAIELLDRVRNYELLEPDDIDTIGRLIFDTEPRVRKAVGKFFVSNIKDLYKASIEDMDKDQFATALPEETDDFMTPCQSWITYKCLTQTLASYDQESESSEGVNNTVPIFATDDIESRYMLATHSIYSHMSELHNWESLAGYLLFDHSSISAEVDDTDIHLTLQQAYKLTSGEETALLDVLYYAVKLYLQSMLNSQTERKGRKTAATEQEIRDKQENTAHNLTIVVPQLLNRFGSTPRAAASILRLEQLLNPDLINDIQSGEGTYSALLEDINKQFTSHSDRKVLAEASKSFRTARAFEQSKELADAKVHEIWTDATNTLQNLLKGKNVDTRGTLERNVLSEVVNTTVRLANLASVNDCTDVLEARLASKKQKGKTAKSDSLLSLLMDLVPRGVPDEETTAQFVEMEDQLCVAATTIISFYFRWKVVKLRNAITGKVPPQLNIPVLTDLGLQRTTFSQVLFPVIVGRPPLDQIRVNAMLSVLDLEILFATIRHMRPNKGSLDDDVRAALLTLVGEVPLDLISEIMATHERMEKNLAKKSNRKIELASASKKRKSTVEAAEEEEEDIEKPPEDSDDEADDSDVDDDVEDNEDGTAGLGGRSAKKQASLLAEQQLCELTSKLVLAVIAGVVPEKIKARLQVNRTKLGKSYAQVIAYLDDKKEKKRPGSSGKGATTTTTGAKTKDNGQQQQDKRTTSATGKEKRAQEEIEPEPMEIEDDPVEDDENDGLEDEEGEDQEEQDEEEEIEKDVADERRDDEILGD